MLLCVFQLWLSLVEDNQQPGRSLFYHNDTSCLSQAQSVWIKTIEIR